MRFSEYSSIRDCDRQIEMCAELMERFDVDADAFVEDFVRRHDLQEGWGEFWQGAKNVVKNAWNAAKERTMNTPPQNMWHSMAQNAMSDKYTKAKTALQGLRDFLNSNDAAKGVFSANKGNMKVADYIGELLKSLESETNAALLAQGKPVAASGPGASQQQVGAQGGGSQQAMSTNTPVDPNNLPPNMRPQGNQQAPQTSTTNAPIDPNNLPPNMQPQQQATAGRSKAASRNKKGQQTQTQQAPNSQQNVSAGGGFGGTWTT